MRFGALLDGGSSRPRSRSSGEGLMPRRPTVRIGREHRWKMLANVLAPSLYARGEHGAARALFESIPAVAPESRVKSMMSRLGIEARSIRGGGMAAQQGLHHLHRHYCSADRSGCRRCRLPELLGGEGMRGA